MPPASEPERIAALATRFLLSTHRKHAALLSPAALAGLERSLAEQLKRTSRQVLQLSGEGCAVLPALLELWDRQVRHWCCFAADFLSHTEAFLKNLGQQPTPGSITVLHANLSDPHRRGRTVVQVQLRDGSRWFYKPRGGAREKAWGELLLWINGNGFPLPFTPAAVYARRSYCWMAAVESAEPHDAAAGARLHFRSGALLYLAHCFRAVDLHVANSVSRDDQLVLVDCETFFHPEIKVPAGFADGAADIRRVGWMVGRSKTKPEAPDFGTPAIAEELVRGFVAMHEFLSLHRRAPDLTAKIAKLRGKRTRYLYRPTRHYWGLLHESLQPDLLEQRASRRNFLYAALSDGLCSPRVVQSEVAQLLAADIPIFHGPPARPRQALSTDQLAGAVATLLRAK